MIRFLTILAVTCLLSVVQAVPGHSQEEVLHFPDPGSFPIRYNLDGDDIRIDYFEQGISRFIADGSVTLVYAFENTRWSLAADHVELNAVTENMDSAMPLTATASGNVCLTDGTVVFTTDGKLYIDFNKRLIASDSDQVFMEFEFGTLTTGNIRIMEFLEGDPDNLISRIIVQTCGDTAAYIELADSDLVDDTILASTSQSMFGSLTFDFSEVDITTTDAKFEIVNGEPSCLDFPNPTVAASSETELVMPSCGITFDPPTLVGNDGVELSMGEETSVTADFLTIVYPISSASFMDVEFRGLCSPPFPELTPVPEQRVTISHPDGTFTANIIRITLNMDGTRKVFATGCASFEVFVEDLEEVLQDDDGE